MQTAVFASAITNIVFNGYRTASCTRKITFSAGSFSEVWDTGTLVGTALSDFMVAEFLPEDNVTSFRLRNHSGGQNFYLKTITVYTTDPPPSLGPIPNQTIGSANTIDNLPLYVTTSVAGEMPSVSATTTSAIPSASYEAFEENGDWFFRFSPADAGITSGNIDFTVSATGIGGTTNLTFTVTVEEGIVKTPPTITLPIASTNAIALRALIVPFTIHEADGDPVETNVVCLSNGVSESYNHANGNFFYTPTLEDANLPQPITFGIAARDIEGAVTNYFNVTVTRGAPPIIAPIDPQQTIAYGGTNKVTLALTPTEDNEIIDTNVTVKAGTDEPAGEHSFSNLGFRFIPALADLGKTFSFTAFATDMDGTAERDFTVAVILATPVLAHCTIDNWNRTSFTATLESDVPGAQGYKLEYTYTTQDGNQVVMTNTVTEWPHTISYLPSTNITYKALAYRDGVESTWSNVKELELHTYRDFVPAVKMTGESGGKYIQPFDGLVTSGSAYWYDGRTIPGWYVTKWWTSFTDMERYYPVDNPGTGQGVFSVAGADPSDRSLAFKANNQDDEYTFGVMFTNCCKYAVTNLHVKYSAAQYRKMSYKSSLTFEYGVCDNATMGILDPAITNVVKALGFTAESGSEYLNPAVETVLETDIPLVGANALKPNGEIALRWYFYSKNNWPALGIDDLEVTWKCAWPGHTVIYVQ